MSGWRRSAAAGLLLLAVYVGLSFLNSPRGFLGTDTGGKVATLRVMTESGRFDPDLGYWAERWDPEGALHPIALTSHLGDRWVNVTTLPALWVGWQLYRVGGYRAALLVPMAGAIAACFAGVALLRRLGASERHAWRGFWLLGLASPLTIYALDFWEHSLGVALLAWAAFLVVDRRRTALRVTLAGILAGTAATMRTEALIYSAVLAVLVAAAEWPRRRLVAGALRVGCFAAAVVLVFGLGALLERQVLGSSIRPARAAGTVAGAPGVASSTRVEEGLETTIGVGGSAGLALGGLLVLAIAAGGGRAIRRRSPLLAAGSLGAAALAYLAVVARGLAFVPGLGPTAPVAVVGVVDGATAASGPAGDERWCRRALWGAAVGALPLVILFQFVGGAGPQWGGRYLLPSSFLLLVVGWVALASAGVRRQLVLVGFSVVITAFGLVWLQVRSHDVDAAIAAIEAHPADAIVSTLPHLAREGGATYGRRRWLTFYSDRSIDDLEHVLDGAGVATLSLVEPAGRRPLEVPGYRRTARSTVPLFDGFDLRVTTWKRTL